MYTGHGHVWLGEEFSQWTCSCLITHGPKTKVQTNKPETCGSGALQHAKNMASQSQPDGQSLPLVQLLQVLVALRACLSACSFCWFIVLKALFAGLL
jgi:hypothetical protein